MKKLLKRPGVQAFVASVICILLGLVIGFIVLLCINPQGAWQSIVDVVRNFFTWSRPQQQLKHESCLEIGAEIAYAASLGLAYYLSFTDRDSENVLLRNDYTHWQGIEVFGLVLVNSRYRSIYDNESLIVLALDTGRLLLIESRLNEAAVQTVVLDKLPYLFRVGVNNRYPASCNGSFKLFQNAVFRSEKTDHFNYCL